MTTVRWGIIGAGRIAQQFARDCAFAPSAELVAVASRSQERSQAFAQEHQLELAFGDYESIHQSDAVDAIYIATPHTHHLQQAMDAMDAGKHVLCEKPMVVSPAECDVLREYHRGANVYLMEAMWTHFLPALAQARTWIDEGRIGTIKHLKADFGYPLLPYRPDLREYDKDLAGGCLLEMGIYPVAIAWYFMQRDPIETQVTAKFAPNGVEDDVVAVFDYGDACATLATSFRCKLQNWCYVIGDEGYIAIPNFWRTDECHLYELDTLVESFNHKHQGDGFEYEIEAASRDIAAGKLESDRVSLEHSLKFQQHMAAIKGLF